MGADDENTISNIRELRAVLVPAQVLANDSTEGVSDGELADAFEGLVARVPSEPANGVLTHGIALFAEYLAELYECEIADALDLTIASRQRPLAETRAAADKMWHWAAMCWTQLAYNEAWWKRHIRQDGDDGSASPDISGTAAPRMAALDRLKEAHTLLRAHFNAPSISSSADSERHRQLLLSLNIECESARAISICMQQVPHLTRDVGFAGPVAGSGILEYMGRLAPLRALAATMEMGAPSRGTVTKPVAEALTTLGECLSPIAPALAMRRLELIDDAIAYCRSRAAHSMEARQLLGALLIGNARDRLESVGRAPSEEELAPIRAAGLEVLGSSPANEAALALLADVAQRQVAAILERDAHDFDTAISAAKAELAHAPSSLALKRVVSDVLWRKAQHLVDLSDPHHPSTSSARAVLDVVLEAWQVDPHENDRRKVIGCFNELAYALVASGEVAKPKAFDEVEAVLRLADKHFSGDEDVARMRVGLLRSRVAWHLDEPAGRKLLQHSAPARAHLMDQIERAWRSDPSQEDHDRRWTAFTFIRLASVDIPEQGWAAASLYDAAIEIIDRGLRLLPNDPMLRVENGVLLRLKGTAIAFHAGGMDGKQVPPAIRRSVLALFEQAWRLNPEDMPALRAMAAVCLTIGELQHATYYVDGALRVEPNGEGLSELRARIRIQRAYEAAVNDFNASVASFNQRRYRDAAISLKRAREQLVRIRGEAWPSHIQGLFTRIEHDQNILRQLGY